MIHFIFAFFRSKPHGPPASPLVLAPTGGGAQNRQSPSAGFDRAASLTLFAIVAISVALYALRVVTAPLARQVDFVPDDAFYYLDLARTFSHIGRWSIDGGLTVTSGFHLLHAYVLTTLFRCFAPDLRQFVGLAVATGAGLSLIGLLPALLHARASQRPDVLYATALIASSPNVAANVVGAMEWPLVLLVSGTYLYVFHHRGHTSAGRTWLFALGALGSLARSEFGLLPASFFAASLLFRRQEHRPYRRSALSGLVGAAVGLLVVLIHHTLATGSPLPYSARIKYHWGTLLSLDTRTDTVRRQLADLFLGLAPSTTRVFNMLVYAGAALLLAIIVLSTIRRVPRIRLFPATPITLIGSAVTLLGAATLYACNGAVQVWYSGLYIAPAICLVTAMVAASRRRVRAALVGLIVLLAMNNIVNVQRRGAHTMPYQRLMFAAGDYLATHPAVTRSRVGAWNAGIMNYVQGGTVIDLDGLVNNDVYDYVMTDRLALYLVRNNVGTIVDFDLMLQPQYARRGGYGDGLLTRNLRRRGVIASDTATGHVMSIFDVDLGAIRRAAGY